MINNKTLIIAWAIYKVRNCDTPQREDWFQDLEPREQVQLIQQANFAILRKHFCPSCWDKTAKRVDVDGGIQMHCECGEKYVVHVEEKIAVVA